jgi:hypothetical protein
MLRKKNRTRNHATNAMYEDFPNGYHANVNTSMTVHNYAITIPAKPAMSVTHEEASLRPIGMAWNGVPIYNDREGEILLLIL